MISRQLLHTRKVICTGYLRSDGMLDVGSEMNDISAKGTNMFFKQVQPGDLIHAMRVVVTVDRELVICHVQVHTDAAPTPHCADSNAGYEALVGLRIGGGFTKKVRALFGGTRGCTHLTELLGPLATTAIQAHYALMRDTRNPRDAHRAAGPMPQPMIAGTCQAYRNDGPAMLKIWPLERRAISPDAVTPPK